MSNETIRYLVLGFLVLHGIGHTGGYWFFAKSWLSPELAQTPARWVFVALWLLAFLVYLAAAFLLYQHQGSWRILAIGASILSLVVSVLFIPSPSLNAAVADVAILVALLALGWPSADIVGA